MESGKYERWIDFWVSKMVRLLKPTASVMPEKQKIGAAKEKKEYSSQFARRAMADLAFTDKDDLYYVVDVKTHRLDTKFNMQNLTSVERLSRFCEDDKNCFSILKVNYKMENRK